MCLHNMVYALGTLIVLPRYSPEAVLELQQSEHINIFAGSPTLFNLNSQGTAAGSALLASHETRTASVPIPLETPPALNLTGLTAYRGRWLDLAQQTKTP